jgi:hypothetical protein
MRGKVMQADIQTAIIFFVSCICFNSFCFITQKYLSAFYDKQICHVVLQAKQLTRFLCKGKTLSCRVFPSFQPLAENSPISERLNDCGTLSHTLQEALPLDSGREQAAPCTHAIF